MRRGSFLGLFSSLLLIVPLCFGSMTRDGSAKAYIARTSSKISGGDLQSDDCRAPTISRILLVNVFQTGRDTDKDYDERLRPSSALTEELETKYSGVARLICPYRRGEDFTCTASLLLNADTMVTAAHCFRHNDGYSVDPKLCAVHFRGPSGKFVEEPIRISYAESRWDDPELRFKASHDIAILKLATPSRSARNAKGYSANVTIKEPRSIEMVAYHNDLPNPWEKRRVTGTAYSATSTLRQPDHVRPEPEWRQRVAVSDYDSENGASGALIIDKITERAIGIHSGSQWLETNRKLFNIVQTYNYFTLFDERFHRDFMRIQAMRPRE